jgi:hypothetical protein
MNQPLTASKQFKHYQGGHCESGAVASIVKNYGFELSEPMAFGISSNIGFAYLPFIKVWGKPLISFRMMPQSILKGVQKQLGIRFCIKTYDNEQTAMDELDQLLAEGKPVGLQVSIAYCTYFLADFRLPFNAHSAIIYGKEGDEYLVSDPLYDHQTRLPREDLIRARFAKGPNAPKGFMYYPLYVQETIDYKKAIKKAIKKVTFNMLQPMFPYYGIFGMKTFIKNFRKLPQRHDAKYIRSYLNNFIIFQEEMGTGGGGFRYMYAAFLQEAYELTKTPVLLEASKKMVQIGDMWRQAALTCAKFIKGTTDTVELDKTCRMYLECAKAEKEVYHALKKIKWG